MTKYRRQRVKKPLSGPQI